MAMNLISNGPATRVGFSRLEESFQNKLAWSQEPGGEETEGLRLKDLRLSVNSWSPAPHVHGVGGGRRSGCWKR